MRPTVVLIGFLDQGNLGLGYIAATLMRQDFEVRILDFKEERASILETVRQHNPVLVGFSIIFQYYVPKFGELASYLRNCGVTCHFTAGGHYPSLRYRETMMGIPELDSIVRFEGELTTVELVQYLVHGWDWRELAGIAYRKGNGFFVTKPRPLISDLDVLPFPVRSKETELVALGRKVSPVVASRGCIRACSFCSIRQFYSEVPGRKVRVRNPLMVAQEMRQLYQENGTTVFLFQDDDFPVWGTFGRRWVQQFTNALKATDLCGRVLWKISCRPDEIDPALFRELREAGLYLVYLGIESGNEAGLRVLNKKLTPDDSLKAVSILKSLDLSFGYGFMLFDPSSTIETLKANVTFLRRLTADGCAPVIFGRMMPYAGTPIEDELRIEGRLRGALYAPDYDFLDPRINLMFQTINCLAPDWSSSADSPGYQVGFALQECWILKRLFPPIDGLHEYERRLGQIMSDYNAYILRLVEDVIAACENGNGEVPSPAEVRAKGVEFSELLIRLRTEFVVENQEVLLGALKALEPTHASPSQEHSPELIALEDAP